MKIKLIAPARKPEWGESFWDLKTLCKLTGRKAGGAPLALSTLAALTPSDIEVVLTDENVEPVNFEEKVDLVGITGMTCVIPRSYEIADEFRKRDVPVVMGGIHASMLPQEAIEHCDAVVIGEAEEIWGQVVQDVQKKNLQKFYQAPRFPDLTNTSTPRWDLLKNDKYCYFTIQTGRGCPYDCEFCSVKEFNGREYRHKSINQVLSEIEIIQKIDSKKLIFFNDDNLLAVPAYTEELCRRLSPKKIKAWMCQSSVNRLEDDNLLDLMYQAGCRVIFVGFESVSQESIESMNKKQINKVEKYKEIVERVHNHKIAVFGSFILGSDKDNKNIFRDTVNFIDKSDISFSMINVMTMLPGTKLYERLKKENRIMPFLWWQSNADWVCFKPSLMSQEQLQKGHRDTLEQIYNYLTLYKRLRNLWDKGIFIREGQRKFFTKTRVFFALYAMFGFNIKQAYFVLRGLCYRKCTSIMWILTGINFNNYSNALKKRIHV